MHGARAQNWDFRIFCRKLEGFKKSCGCFELFRSLECEGLDQGRSEHFESLSSCFYYRSAAFFL
jgi:hypothetical protein